jgi:hypothetical protein
MFYLKGIKLKYIILLCVDLSSFKIWIKDNNHIANNVTINE